MFAAGGCSGDPQQTLQVLRQNSLWKEAQGRRIVGERSEERHQVKQYVSGMDKKELKTFLNCGRIAQKVLNH